MIKPIKISFFSGVIFIIYFALMIIVPAEGLKISDEITIRLPSLPDFSLVETENHPEKGIVTTKVPMPFEYSQLFFKRNKNGNFYYPDTSFIKNSLDTLPVLRQSENIRNQNFIKTENSIEFPSNDPSVFYSFFSALYNLKNTGELIRILHYGDSQIEGDRITSYLRNEFQKKFGGKGVGLIPVNLISEFYMSLKYKISENWKKYSVLELQDEGIDNMRTGVLMSISRFSPFEMPNNEENIIYESYIDINKSFLAYSLARRFSSCKLFYGFNRRPVIVELYKENELYDAEILLPAKDLKLKEWNFNEEQTNISIRFRGEDSPEIYGISLDDRHGVSVENIPLRGSRGLDFTKTDPEFLKKMASLLNVKLIIYQFGLNLVPELSGNYNYYEQRMADQLTYLKNCIPSAAVLVIGVSDVARKNRDKFESYPNVELIIKAQRNAAFKTGCAFWDMYRAMGGKNSIISWVSQSPALAQKDFTHFTFEGSKKIAEMMYTAIIKEYESFSGQAAESDTLVVNNSWKK